MEHLHELVDFCFTLRFAELSTNGLFPLLDQLDRQTIFYRECPRKQSTKRLTAQTTNTWLRNTSSSLCSNHKHVRRCECCECSKPSILTFATRTYKNRYKNLQEHVLGQRGISFFRPILDASQFLIQAFQTLVCHPDPGSNKGKGW